MPLYGSELTNSITQKAAQGEFDSSQAAASNMVLQSGRMFTKNLIATAVGAVASSAAPIYRLPCVPVPNEDMCHAAVTC